MPTRPTKPNLTNCERRRIIDELLERSTEGVLPRGALADVAKRYGRGRSTVSELWRFYSNARLRNDPDISSDSRIKQNSGRKKIDRADAVAKLQAVPIEDRQVIRRAAVAAGTSKYLVTQLLKEGAAYRRSDRLKPVLTAENRLKRIEHVLSYIDDSTLFFEPMLDVVHVDEKWFNADKDKRSYIMFEGETLPTRSRQSKRFIPKTMFFAAVARPR